MRSTFVELPDPNDDPLSVRWNAFPEMRDPLDKRSDWTVVYAEFAEIFSSNRQDDQLWSRAYAFIDSLAVSGHERLVDGLFLTFRDHRELADRLKTNVGPPARKLLEEDVSSSR